MLLPGRTAEYMYMWSTMYSVRCSCISQLVGDNTTYSCMRMSVVAPGRLAGYDRHSMRARQHDLGSNVADV